MHTIGNKVAVDDFGQVTCRLNERDWGLHGRIQECKEAAERMNDAVKSAFDLGRDPRVAVAPVVSAFTHCWGGAGPYPVLEKVVSAVNAQMKPAIAGL